MYELHNIESGKTYYANSVILAMGAWSAHKDGCSISLPISVTEEVVGYFEPWQKGGIDHSFKSMPIFIHRFQHGLGGLDVGFYG